MEKQHHKEQDFLDRMDRMVKDAGLESPSLDFTQKVLQRTLAPERSPVFQYKPIFSKKVLWGMGLAIVGLEVLAFILPSTGGDAGLAKDLNLNLNLNLDLGERLGRSLGTVTMPKIPNTVVYGALCLGFMVCVQAYWIKEHFGKRFA